MHKLVVKEVHVSVAILAFTSSVRLLVKRNRRTLRLLLERALGPLWNVSLCHIVISSRLRTPHTVGDRAGTA